MDLSSFAVSLIGGGAVGGLINVAYQWRNRKRDLRTAFYPVLNNMNAGYLIRMEQQRGGKELVLTPGIAPLGADRDFVTHRTAFLTDLIKYTDLKEVIILRQKILDNAFKGSGSAGPVTINLVPEAQAIEECMSVLHKELKLNSSQLP
jgi:hypothetical protein